MKKRKPLRKPLLTDRVLRGLELLSSNAYVIQAMHHVIDESEMKQLGVTKTMVGEAIDARAWVDNIRYWRAERLRLLKLKQD